MKIFVTGATGFIGSAIAAELRRAGHEVTGLARSDKGAAALAAVGVHAHRGDLQDLASLQAGAAAADGVVHAGFIHDFTNYAENCAIDREAIRALAAGLGSSARPLLVASGTALAVSSGVITEEARAPAESTHLPRVLTELAIDEAAARGVRAAALRFPPTVHGEGDHGFVPMLVDIARKAGVSAYVGAGDNRWPAVHRLDAAVVARLALESSFAPGARFHPVAEEGVPFRAIAAAIGAGLGVPVVTRTADEAAAHFGWMQHFVALDKPTSSELTRRALGWTPAHPTLLEDLAGPSYF